MERSLPFGVKYVRTINRINIGLLFLAGVLLPMISVPNVIKSAQDAGHSAHPILLLVVGLVSSCIAWLPVADKIRRGTILWRAKL